MSKHGNSKETIYYSEKLNKWVGQFTTDQKENGKINRKSVYGNTRKEVKKKIKNALAEVQNKTYIDTNDITIGKLGKQLIKKKFNSNIINEATYNRAYEHLNIYKIVFYTLLKFKKLLFQNYKILSVRKKIFQIPTLIKYFKCWEVYLMKLLSKT